MSQNEKQPTGNKTQQVSVQENLAKAKTIMTDITTGLKQNKIYFKEQKNNLWIFPDYLKKKVGYSLIIPGSKCPMLKNFMGVKFTGSKVYLIETTNRISFCQSLKPALVKFVNFLNLTTTIAHFYIFETVYNSKEYILINANRELNMKFKSNYSKDFIEEIVTIDKVYQSVLLDQLPKFLFKELNFSLIFNKVETQFEISKMMVCRAIKGMGFSQEKKSELNTYLGKQLNINLAVNIDYQQDDNLFSDWKVLALVVDVFDQIITVKAKLCKNRSLFKIENEKTQMLVKEFINLANLNLKKAEFKFSYSQSALSLESTIITAGLDYTEIQYSFQETFTYVIESFKKYLASLAIICTSTNQDSQISYMSSNSTSSSAGEGNCETAAWKIKRTDKKCLSQDDIRSMYRELKKNLEIEEENEYTRFSMNSSHSSQLELLIPLQFETIKYEQGFRKEKKLVEYLKANITECFHMKVDEKNKTIKYPKYNQVQSFIELINPSSDQIESYQSFLSKLYSKKFSIINPINNLGITKQGGNHFLYFSKFPISSYLQIKSSKSSQELTTHLLDLKESVQNTYQSPIQEEPYSFIKRENFDEPFDINSTINVLAGLRVKLEEVTKEKIEALTATHVRKISNIESFTGIYEENSKLYLIREVSSGINLESITLQTVRKYIIDVAKALMMFRKSEDEVFVVTEDDLSLSSSGMLKIQIRSHGDRHLWNCFSSTKTPKQKQVYSLAMLAYKLCCNRDPFEMFKGIENDVLITQLQIDQRIPIFEWGFEKRNPVLVNFLRMCWEGEIDSLQKMWECYPVD